MKALILTSTSLRHCYFIKTIAQKFDVIAALTEMKKNYYSLQRQECEVVRQHFVKIKASEQEWFASEYKGNLPEIQEVCDINEPRLINWARQEKFDVLCLFGTSILKREWLQAFPNKIVNLHLGLSPFYRGSATLFWPFVNRELQYLGTTIHLAVAKVDAGAIIKRVQSDLKTSESYYDITHRLIRNSIDQFPAALESYLLGQIRPYPQEDIKGKLYRKADFTPESLRKALDYVGEGLTYKEINRIKFLKKCLY